MAHLSQPLATSRGIFQQNKGWRFQVIPSLYGGWAHASIATASCDEYQGRRLKTFTDKVFVLAMELLKKEAALKVTQNVAKLGD
ncbi:uncharacterized protein [Elaeis guineensis]|uniref:uncharacterized protein isoform X2 n=1 Tax=Elaeis guineensis var. tenera TaxID=51953 RepID=UPI003C6D925A